jgi:hypothetical protein
MGGFFERLDLEGFKATKAELAPPFPFTNHQPALVAGILQEAMSPHSMAFEIAPSRFLWLLMLSSATFTTAQAAPAKPKFWDRATIQQADGTVSVRANFPRPLQQAIEAIREEYGWTVDYEDPPYESYDLVDVTDPSWRKAHPDAKGATGLAGGLFTTTFNGGSDMSSGSPDEERTLQKVVADYNASGNPGQFMLKIESADRFSVVGIAIKDSSGNEKAVAPVLDTRISLPLPERSVKETIELISRTVSEKSLYKVEFGNAPTIEALQTRMRVGGDHLTARELFAQVASATRMFWLLLYDANAQCYFMNMDIARKPISDGLGPLQPKPIPKH